MSDKQSHIPSTSAATRDLTGHLSTVEFDTCSELSNVGVAVVGLSANHNSQILTYNFTTKF